MSLDMALWLAGIGTEIAVISVLVFRRMFRRFPVFCVYLVWAIFNDSAMMLISRHFPARYFQSFLIEMPLDAVLQFCVLVELAWSVLRPMRDSLSRKVIPSLAAVILFAGAIIWPIAGIFALPGPTPQWHLLFHLQQTFSLLRVVVFLLLAGLSQLLAIGWRDRELQIATGLGIYSIVSLCAAAMHSYPASPAFYHGVDEMVMASYLVSLLYWVFSFVQKEAPRQEFSPKMQSILLSVAGAARSSRIALQDGTKSRH